jgi:ArsR family transcriptional regulator, arsenate/arsenite/antimonite-responsive transcriptional repressor
LTGAGPGVIICIMTQTRKYKSPPAPRRQTPAVDAPCCQDLGRLLVPRFFKALADPSRLAVLVRLTTLCGEATVSQVAAGIPVDLSVVSRHLAKLRDAGILAAERRGQEVVYSVRYPELSRSLREIADAIDRCCPGIAPAGGLKK